MKPTPTPDRIYCRAFSPKPGEERLVEGRDYLMLPNGHHAGRLASSDDFSQMRRMPDGSHRPIWRPEFLVPEKEYYLFNGLERAFQAMKAAAAKAKKDAAAKELRKKAEAREKRRLEKEKLELKKLAQRERAAKAKASKPKVTKKKVSKKEAKKNTISGIYRQAQFHGPRCTRSMARSRGLGVLEGCELAC